MRGQLATDKIPLQQRRLQASNMAAEAKEDPDALTVLTVTWNVGNAAPPTDLRDFLPLGGGGYDIIAVMPNI